MTYDDLLLFANQTAALLPPGRLLRLLSGDPMRSYAQRVTICLNDAIILLEATPGDQLVNISRAGRPSNGTINGYAKTPRDAVSIMLNMAALG